MANFEEKILAYLDGSLPEADREDVLAGISGERAGSHERRLFDAHLRLQDLYSVVRKPVSAPLALQRELATKVPVLALKLPYLAAPPERRNRVAGGWFSSIRSSWINTILFLALALLAGGVWYAVNTNSHSDVSSQSPNVSSQSPNVSSQSPNAPAGGALNGSAPTNRGPPGTGSGKVLGNIASPNSNPPSTTVNTNPSHSNVSNVTTMHSNLLHLKGMQGTRATKGTQLHSSANRNSTANGTTTHSLNSKGTLRANETPSNSTTTISHESLPTTVQTPANVNSPGMANAPAMIKTPGTANAPAPPSEPLLPPLDLRAIGITEQPIHYQLSHDAPIAYPIEENASSFVPLHVYVLAGERFITTSPTLSPYVLDNKQRYSGNFSAPSYEFGAEYELSPWTSAGVRVGQTSFAEYQPFQYGTRIQTLNSQSSDDSVNAVPAVWCALAVTETFNPGDRMRYALSLAGGPAFTTPSVAWLGMAEASVSYDLTPALMFRGGVSFDISRVNQGTQNYTPPTSTAGIIVASSGGALTSRAIGISAGISFHP